jgi:hypothetical protein
MVIIVVLVIVKVFTVYKIGLSLLCLYSVFLFIYYNR